MKDDLTDKSVVVIRSRFALAPFEVWLAAVAVYTGLARFIPLPPSGGARAVDAAFPTLVVAWSVLYALGGLAVLGGMLAHSNRLESAGLHLLGSGVTVSFFATLAAGGAILPTVIVQGGVIAACVARLWVLRRLAR